MNYTLIKKLTHVLTFSAMFVVATLGAVPASAAATVSVTPASASDSSTTPLYGVNLTSCLEVFNWQQYLNDLANNITNSNPYDKFDCVREESLVVNGTRTVTQNAGAVTSVEYSVSTPTVSNAMYKDFTVGQTTTRNEFGDLPVLGIFPNQGNPAQALSTYEIDGTLMQSESSVDRSIQTGLDSIFNTQKQNLIYTTGGTREGMPRTPYTGQEIFDNNDNWLGGMCTVENGKMVPRTKTNNPITYQGRNFGAEDYGFNIDDPITTCAWPNTAATVAADVYDPEGVAKDNLLEVYQFVYKIPYPADFTECNTLFPSAFNDYNSCISWFRERYSQPFTGQATGDALYYTYTFYGAWNDVYTQWVGWENPDIDKARANFNTNASLAQLRGYYGDPEFELRQVYGDTVQPYNFTYNELVNKMNSASTALQNDYQQRLADKYSSFIRGADGYSVYAI
jgi:hypothetical protein